MMNVELRKSQEFVYNTQNNYYVEYNTADTDKNCCAIYFSSNAIFYPDSVEIFEKKIIERNRYELQRMKIKRANKHIFVRDVYKQWYVQGINKTTNTIDKLVELLKRSPMAIMN